jgi:hypothetical protein
MVGILNGAISLGQHYTGGNEEIDYSFALNYYKTLETGTVYTRFMKRQTQRTPT